MGALLRPVGPEEPRVYWIRRGLAVLAVLVLVGVLVWAVLPKGQAPVSAAPAPTTSAASAPATTATQTPSESPSASPTPTGPVACENRYIEVSVVGFQRVKVSDKQTFKVAITNTGAQPCILAVGPSSFALTVSSGSDRIWSTADCDKWVPSKKLTAKKGAGYEFDVEWPLRRSAEGCKLTKDKLRPGTYVAKGVFDDGPSASQVMQLVA
jgi:hypothetical protein